MKTRLSNTCANRGFSLWLCMSIVGIGIAGMAAIIGYSVTAAKKTARDNEFLATSYVAESAVEKIRASLQWDNINWGELQVFNRLNNYAATLVSSTDNVYFASYSISTPTVARVATNAPIALDAPYLGYTNLGYKFQIIATASNTTSQYHIPVTVGLEVNLVTMNIFHNAIFYGPGMDLEINPGAPMTISGSVYGGGNTYINPGSSLLFSNDIATSGSFTLAQSPLDPTGNRGGPTPTFKGSSGLSLSNSPMLTFALGTNQGGVGGNGPAAVHAILDVPPTNEPVFSAVGTNRYYNKADLIIKVTDTGLVAMSANYTGNSQVLTNFPFSAIVNTNDTFYDKREGKYAKTTAIDVGALKKYAETNTELAVKIGITNINTLFVVDQRSTNNPAVTNILSTNVTTKSLSSPWKLTRTNSSPTSYTYTQTNIQPAFTSMPGVTLTNGAVLPNGGLTVATPDPVYIKGDYNTSTDGVNFYPSTSDTSHTRPGAVMGDSITVLSKNFSDANSTNTIASGTRTATNTTVNAAFLSGNVPSNGAHYSGGVENFPRFLEDWGGSPQKTFTYNGSMVCMFPSQIAKSPWGSSDVYNPPARNWAFDKNFLGDSAHLPPSAPNTVVSSRGRWAILNPGATSF